MVRISLYEGNMKLSAVSFSALASMAPPRSTATGAPTGAPTDAAPSRQEEMAARKLQQAKDAVATLKTIKTTTSDDQKARAAQKVKELKARLQALKMIYAGDPKKLARLAAQIARELAAAVRSYTSAGGGAGDLGGADASEGAAGGTAAGEAPTDAGEPDAAKSAAPEAAAPEPAQPDADADESKAEVPGTRPSTGDQRATGTARDKADEDFKNEARDLARALKAALRRKHAKHQDDDGDQRSGALALASVDQALGALPMSDVGVAALAGI